MQSYVEPDFDRRRKRDRELYLSAYAAYNGEAGYQNERKQVTMDLSNFTPEQIEKAKACSTPEELFALAKEEGVTLSDDVLEQISGGKNWFESFMDGMN